MPPDHIAKIYHFNMRYKTLIPDRKERGNGFPPQVDFSLLVIHTDGSKINSGSSVGNYLEGLNLESLKNLGELSAVF